MNQPTTFYTVDHTPVSAMTESQIRKESDDLKREIIAIETRMGEKKAWAKAEGSTKEHLVWLARTKKFYALLMVRYTVIRAAIKNLNRRKITMK